MPTSDPERMDRLEEIRKLAERYAVICDDRTFRDERIAICQRLSKLDAADVAFFIMSLVSFSEDHITAHANIVVLTNRLIDILEGHT